MFQDEFPRNKHIGFNIYRNIYEHISVKTTIYAKLRETNNVKKLMIRCQSSFMEFCSTLYKSIIYKSQF